MWWFLTFCYSPLSVAHPLSGLILIPRSKACSGLARPLRKPLALGEEVYLFLKTFDPQSLISDNKVDRVASEGIFAWARLFEKRPIR